ncbi:MAG: lipid-A-disaccharide synthase [Alphaproteobacteria bacterium]|nr:lipid-A-disaccharide synthase [Alphaproteobacteria bacterium]
MQALTIYLIAGEPSGDLLGSRLMRALKKKMGRGVRFVGVGGETMAQEGLRSLFDISDLSVMGLTEVIPSIPKILKRIHEIGADIREKKPDIVMTIDSYAFSARVHRMLKKIGYTRPHVHCVAPQVWAWKAGRAKKIGAFMDHLFCLLPNEESYFTPHGVKTTFIGHPVVEGGADKGDGAAFRKKHGIPSNAVVMAVLPGSRKNEVKYLMPTFKAASEELSRAVGDLFVVIPTVAPVAAQVARAVQGWAIPHVVVQGEAERYDAFASAQVALAASGTVSLELALAGVPHLIAYKMSPLTGYILKRMLKIRFANLLNLLVNKEVIPELLQDKCTVDNIVAAVEKLLKNPHQDVGPSLQKLGAGRGQLPSEKMAQVLRELALKGRHD